MRTAPSSPASLPLLVFACALAVAFAAVPAALAQPGFSKSFSPDVVGMGNVSALTFEINNAEMPTGAEDLAFTDVLPAGVTLADPVSASTDCASATLTAPAGGTTVTVAGGRLGADEVCTVQVNVTSSTVGLHTNTSGDLTSTAGNSGPAVAGLTVEADRLLFTKTFAPDAVVPGDVTTLSFEIENPTGGNVFNISFTDNLPTGLTVASPASLTTDCIGNPSAPAGGSAVSFFSGFLGPMASCTLSVNVRATSAGTFDNVTTDLTSTLGTSGKATDRLHVMVQTLQKLFDNPAAPGEETTLTFTLTNLDRSRTATGLTFTDDLDATLTGLVATGLPAADVCGAGSEISGTDLLTLTGGTLGPGESCTIEVPVQVPTGAASGEYPNTTSTVSYDLGGTATVAPAATDDLEVVPFPVLEKGFVADTVTTGSSAVLDFTLTNSSTTQIASGISFTDDLTAFLSIPSSASVLALPPAGFCDGTGTVSATGPPAGPIVLTVSGATLAPGDSCTFQVEVAVAEDLGGGVYTNRTGDVSATVGGSPVIGPGASADLTVVAAPEIAKEFVGGVAAPGDMVTLELTLSYPPDAPAGATGLAFTDDLDAALPGLVATGLPTADVCGAGSELSGTSLLTLTGGSLGPGESCTFSATLQVPAGATPGYYDNVTSQVTGTTTAAGVAPDTVTGPGAAAQLLVSGLALEKSFLDDPTVAGGTVTLQFVVQNDAAFPATDIQFQDDLGAVLPGLAATGLPMNDVCGVGSQLFAAGSSLFLTGGNLAAATSCTFAVTLQVPAGAAPGEYINSTGPMTATVEGEPVSLPGASDMLIVVEPLSIEKSFLDDPVAPGGTVILEFTLTNGSGSDPATAVTFTDDLDAVLSGLVAVGLPMSDVCGAGSTLSGTSLLTLSGGTIAPSSSCTFQVTLQVPASVPLGTVAINTTSSISGTVGVATTGAPATDELEIQTLGFSKSFADPVGPGTTTTLTFTIENLDTASAVSNLAFVDDLEAVLAGLVATGLPMSGVCGAGSVVSGSSAVNLTGGELPAGGSCSFDVIVQVPAGAAPGSYPNTTSELTAAGITVAAPATDSLEVEPPPAFAKAFAPTAIVEGGVATLTFTIDNSAASVAATGLAFTDALPAGLEVASPPGASTTCTGGSLTTVAGTGTIAYSGGSVAAGAVCTVEVDVVGAVPGSHVNVSGELTSSLGSSGTATAILEVGNEPPLFSQEFVPGTIDVGEATLLVFTIDNSASAAAATRLDFAEVLPAGLEVASPNGASTTCIGGTVVADPGTTAITYIGGTVPAGAVCTVQVAVIATAPGTYEVTSGDLTSSSGSSGTSTATLQVHQSVLDIPVDAHWALLLLIGLLGLTGVAVVGLRG